jgi:alkylhydroperoxidase/carboxymuconolactone decarboxylase family protein YurZ
MEMTDHCIWSGSDAAMDRDVDPEDIREIAARIVAYVKQNVTNSSSPSATDCAANAAERLAS